MAERNRPGHKGAWKRPGLFTRGVPNGLECRDQRSFVYNDSSSYLDFGLPINGGGTDRGMRGVRAAPVLP